MRDLRTLLYTCCQDYTILQLTPCGREFFVCVECDNGINECTEGECLHPTKETS